MRRPTTACMPTPPPQWNPRTLAREDGRTEDAELPTTAIIATSSLHAPLVPEPLEERATRDRAANAADPREEVVHDQLAVNRESAKSVESLSPVNSCAHWMEPFIWTASSVEYALRPSPFNRSGPF